MATTALLILDGFGIGNPDPKSNAIYAQGTPNLDRLKAQYSHHLDRRFRSGRSAFPTDRWATARLATRTSARAASSIQMLVKITKDIEDGVFFENKALCAAMDNCKKNDSALHLMGLVSPGGVHSHTEHLYRPARDGEAPRPEQGLRALLPRRPRTSRRIPAGSTCRSWSRR